MKTYDINNLSDVQLQDLCKRQAIRFDTVLPVVQEVIDQVKTDGDVALSELTKRFDRADIATFAVSQQEIEAASGRITPDVKDAFKQAAANIKKFHKAQLSDRKTVETMPGITCFAEMRPIEKVGLYVPGGTAPLPSTVLMLAIPAKLADCKEIILCTPPSPDGSIPDITLYAASLCGVSNIYELGGAQAIAAMAYGTESVPKVSKIFGPGNQYVTAAKMRVSTDPDGAAIDMPAGPSEVLVIADKDARADFVASDLLSQAEHGPDSLGVLICTDAQKTAEILREVERQVATLPRKTITKQALNNSFALVVDTIEQAISFSNRFAVIDQERSFVSGDRKSDEGLAKNLGLKFVPMQTNENFYDTIKALVNKGE